MNSKKATVTVVLVTIIGIILALIIAGFITGFGIPPILSLLPGGNTNTDSFNGLIGSIISLSPSANSKQYNYKITEKNLVVAFTPINAPEEAIVYAPTPDGQIRRPTSCAIEQSCICLCDAKIAIEQSCTSLNTNCAPLRGINTIDGISISNGEVQKKQTSGLYIKGKTNILLQLSLVENNKLEIRIVE